MKNRNILTSVVIISCLMCLLDGCSPKVLPPAESRDSVRVEIREYPVYDTLKIEVPKEVERIVTYNDSSHLETTFAVSEAITRNGMLFHSISNKPQTWIKPIEVKMRETLTVSSHIERTPPQIVEVEKKLTWWQQTQMIGFKVLIFLILASLAVKYRKGILKLVKLLK